MGSFLYSFFSSIQSFPYKVIRYRIIIVIMKFAAVAILSLAAGAFAQIDPEHCGPQYGNVACKDNNCCSQYGWVRFHHPTTNLAI